jgi:hypothetical protein
MALSALPRDRIVRIVRVWRFVSRFT